MGLVLDRPATHLKYPHLNYNPLQLLTGSFKVAKGSVIQGDWYNAKTTHINQFYPFQRF
jgi:hypothetical protein